MSAPAATKPILVLMAGLPGTGKSTLAYALAATLGWIVIDKDLIHSAMISTGAGKLDSTPAAYEAALVLVQDLVTKQQRSVILDTAGRQPFLLERSREIASQSGARLRIIRCVAPGDVRMSRLSGRTRLPSQWAADFGGEDEQNAWYAHLPRESLVIHTDEPFELCLSSALKYLTEDE